MTFNLPDREVITDFSVAEVEQHRDRPSLVTLYLSGSESSALDMNDPEYLEFEYMQQFRAVIDSVFTGREALRALHLGGAGCAFARALDAGHPGSRQLVSEIDAKLAKYVREWFDLPPSPRLRIRVQDARETLDTTQATWDVIVRDAFINQDVPAHLRTLEVAERASQILSERGIFLLNSVASTGLKRFNSQAAQLLHCFPHVLGIIDPSVLRGRRYGNLVLAASHSEFPVALIDRAVRRLPLPARIVSQKDLEKRAKGAVVFHDADIPGFLIEDDETSHDS